MNNQNKIYNIDACILAGGKSLRMGGYPKGLLKINEISFIKHIANVLSVFDNVLLSANGDYYDDLKLVKFTDTVKNIGPIGGIYTALLKSQKQYVLFVPCDMPCISNEIIELLLKFHNDYDCIIARQGDKIYPVLGLYSKNCIQEIEKMISANDYKLMRLIDSVKSICVDIPIEYNLSNINTPNDYDKIK